MSSQATEPQLATRVEAAVERMRPALQLDGGDVELLAVDAVTGTVRVALKGDCTGCSALSTTVLFGLERALKQMVPGVTKVDAESLDGNGSGDACATPGAS